MIVYQTHHAHFFHNHEEYEELYQDQGYSQKPCKITEV